MEAMDPPVVKVKRTKRKTKKKDKRPRISCVCVNCLKNFDSEHNEPGSRHNPNEALDFRNSPFTETFSRRRNLDFSHVQLNSEEALKIVFRPRRATIFDDRQKMLCSNCLELFTPLFQLYVRFLSLSGDESYVKMSWEYPSSGHRNLNHLLEKLSLHDVPETDELNDICLSDVQMTLGPTSRTTLQQQNSSSSKPSLAGMSSSTEADTVVNKTERVVTTKRTRSRKLNLKTKPKLEPPDLSFGVDSCALSYAFTVVKSEYLDGNEANADAIPIPTDPESKMSIKPELMETHSPGGKATSLSIPESGHVQCKKCCETFSNTNWLQKHMKCHSDKNRYFCNFCLCGFTMREKYIDHMHRGHPNEKSVRSSIKIHDLVCQVCPRKYLEPVPLAHHVAKMHSKCHFCQAEFPTYDEIMEHAKSMHAALLRGKKDVTYMCEDCGFIADNRDKLRNHQRNKHPNPKNRSYYSCPHCNRDFSSKYVLGCHLISHTDEKLFKCDQCSISFKFKWGLDEHKKMHDGSTTCELCGTVSSTVQNLRRHIAHVHHRVKTRDYKRLPAGDGRRKKLGIKKIQLENLEENAYLMAKLAKQNSDDGQSQSGITDKGGGFIGDEEMKKEGE